VGKLFRAKYPLSMKVQEWGHDFRDTYRRLGTFRERFPGVPIMALTASATAACVSDAFHTSVMCTSSRNHRVQLDIVRSLRISDDHLYKVTSFCHLAYVCLLKTPLRLFILSTEETYSTRLVNTLAVICQLQSHTPIDPILFRC
jgi:hypothetical protein